MDDRLPATSWDEIADVFSRAAEVPGGQREAWLDDACAGRPQLRREVESMLIAHEQPGLELEERLLVQAETPLPDQSSLGSYRIQRFLGRGGMGDVYLAERTGAGYEQVVAVKLLRLRIGGAEAAARFRRERRIVANLNHPAVVPLLDSGIAPDGRPYLVLQYVDGQPITRYCDEKQLSREERLRLFIDVCRAVQYAHTRLIIHRDLKPTNILVTAEGEPRLLDFGIAKALDDDDGETALTREGAPMTPERAAPEQLRGDLPSTATDVWALGVLLYELMTGDLPFDVHGRSRTEIERAVTTTKPARTIGGDLDTVISVALRAEPDQRYPSAAQLADDVERVLRGQPILARPHSVGYLLRRFVSRNRAAVAASALTVASLIAFAIVAAVQSREVARERDRAAAEEVKANAVVDLLAQVLEGADPTSGATSPTIDVSDLLARGEQRAAELSPQPAVQARLLHVLGKVHLARSGFAKARDLLARSYASHVTIGGRDDLRTLEVAFDLARAEGKLGLRNAAKTRLRSIVLALERQKNARPDLLAGTLEELSELSDPNERRALVHRALALRKSLDPPRPMQVAQSLNQLGILAYHEGDRETAARHYREALAIMEREGGADHPHALSVKNNLAVAVAEPAERQALLRSIIAAQARRVGDPSELVATGWNNLGTAIAESGDFQGAMAALEEARRRWVRLVGDDHQQTLNTRRNMAALASLSGHGETSLREMNDIVARAGRRGIDPVTLASLRAQQAGTLFHLGRRAEAKRLLIEVSEELRRLEPPGAPTSTNVRFALAIVALAEGNGVEAEAAVRAVLSVREMQLPAGHPMIAEARVALGRALVAQGKVAEGRALIAANLPHFSKWAFAHPNDVAAARAAMSD